MISEYTLKARIFPAILTSLPLIVLINATFDSQVHQWLNSDDYAALFGKGTLAIAIVFALSQFNRFVAAEVFERLISKDETNFPTTRLLLPNNDKLSDTTRKAIGKKVNQDFGQELPSSVTPSKESKARRQISDIVRMMRERTRGHKLLLQHNIEYGFARNLIGACPLVLLVSGANIYLYKQHVFDAFPVWGYRASIAYSIAAVGMMVLSKVILDRYGIRYARVLFQAYLDAK